MGFERKEVVDGSRLKFLQFSHYKKKKASKRDRQGISTIYSTSFLKSTFICRTHITRTIFQGGKVARINIEDSIFSDGRFKALTKILDGDEEKALGKVILAWRTSQDYHVKGENIPDKIFEIMGFESLTSVGLAVKKDDGFYVCGTKDQFSWLVQKKEAAKKGGEANKLRLAKTAETKPNASRDEAETKPNASRDEAETKPNASPLTLTLSPTLTHNSYIYTASKVLTLFNEKLGGVGKIGHAPFILASNMQDDFKNLNGSAEFQKPKAWENFFDTIAQSEYLTVSRPVDFGWLLKLDNAAAILGGRYRNRDLPKKAIVGHREETEPHLVGDDYLKWFERHHGNKAGADENDA